MIGTAPNCRPQCVLNSDCPSNLNCINQKCIDPCPGSCALNSQCRVVNHSPVCSCVTGFTGDGFSDCRLIPAVGKNKNYFINAVMVSILFLYFYTTMIKTKLLENESILNFHLSYYAVPPSVVEKPKLCDSNPCGTSAQCAEKNGAISCVCPNDYIGDPYVSCRPECLINTDCQKHQSCSKSRCVNPCTGSCGINADCRVVNHIPICSCKESFTGDPYGSCRPIPVIGTMLTFPSYFDRLRKHFDHSK